MANFTKPRIVRLILTEKSYRYVYFDVKIRYLLWNLFPIYKSYSCYRETENISENRSNSEFLRSFDISTGQKLAEIISPFIDRALNALLNRGLFQSQKVEIIDLSARSSASFKQEPLCKN